MGKGVNCLHLLDACKTAFLLVDIQEKFRCAMPLFPALLENAKKLLKAGKVFKVPLFVSQQYPEKLGKTVSELDISHARMVIDKTRFSMLNSDLEAQFDKVYGGMPRDAVILGLETHVCVEQTAIKFLEKGINVFVAADCCCSRLNQDRDWALRRLQQRGCFICTSENIIFSMLRDKNNPEFNDIRKLVTNVSADMQLAKNESR